MAARLTGHLLTNVEFTETAMKIFTFSCSFLTFLSRQLVSNSPVQTLEAYCTAEVSELPYFKN